MAHFSSFTTAWQSVQNTGTRKILVQEGSLATPGLMPKTETQRRRGRGGGGGVERERKGREREKGRGDRKTGA